jgi:hypothetical protein
MNYNPENKLNEAEILIAYGKFRYGKPPHLGKIIEFDGKEFVKKNPSIPAEGTIQKYKLTLETLAKLLSESPSNSALVSGHLLDDTYYVNEGNKQYAQFTTTGNERGNIISRTKAYIDYTKKSGYMLIDFDPENDATEQLTPSQLHKILCQVHQGFIGAGFVAKYSSSAGIKSSDGNVYKVANGFHMFYLVENSSTINSFCQELYNACWLSGYGFIKISENGHKLDRVKLFDKNATNTGRFSFESEPQLKGDLTREVPPIKMVNGGWLDTTLINISSQEAQAKIAESKGKANINNLSELARQKYKNKLVAEVGEALAVQMISAQEGGVIYAERIVVLKGRPPMGLLKEGFKSGYKITIADAIKHADGKTVILEDSINARPDKDLYLYPKTLTARTFAHGGATFNVLYPQKIKHFDEVFNRKSKERSQITNEHIEQDLIVDALPIRSALFSCMPCFMGAEQIRKCIFAVNHSYRGHENGRVLLDEWLTSTQWAANLPHWWQSAGNKLITNPVTFGTLRLIANEFGWTENQNLGPQRVIDDIIKWDFCDLGRVPIKILASYCAKKISTKQLNNEQQDSLAHAAAFKYVKHCFAGNVSLQDMATHISHCLPDANFHEIHNYIINAEYRQRAAAQRLVTFGNVANALGLKTIDDFEEIDFDPDKKQSIFIRAPMGSGKTEYCAEKIVGQMLESGRTVLVLTHRERLSSRNAISYSPHGANYTDDDTENRVLDYKSEIVKVLSNDNSGAIQAVSMCVNSLILHGWPRWIKNGVDCVIVDEASQVLDHLANPKVMGNSQSQVWQSFLSLLSNAKNVVMMDAGLSDSDLEQLVSDACIDDGLKNIRPLSNISVYEMAIEVLPENRQFKDLHVLPDEAIVLQKIKECCINISKGNAIDRFMFACDSKTLPWVVKDLATENGVNSDRILVITGHGGKTIQRENVEMAKRTEDFIANPDGEANKYDIVAFSPAIDSGLSLKANPAHFHHMFGVFQGVAAASACLQQLRRLRTTNSATIFLDPGRTFKAEGDEELMRSKALSAGLDPAETRWFDEFVIARGKRIAAMITNQGATIAAISEPMGFKIIQERDSQECLRYLLQEAYTPEFDEIMQFCIDASKAISDEHLEAVMNAKPVNYVFVTQLRSGYISSSQRLSVKRFYIADTLGLPFDCELNYEQVKWALNENNRKAVLNFELLAGYRDPEEAESDKFRPLALQRHEAKRVELASNIRDKALNGIDRYGNYLHDDLPWVQKLFHDLWECKDELVKFGLVPSRWMRGNMAKPESAVKSLKQVLAVVGLNFKRGKLAKCDVDKLGNVPQTADYYKDTAEFVPFSLGNKVQKLDSDAHKKLVDISKKRKVLRIEREKVPHSAQYYKDTAECGLNEIEVIALPTCLQNINVDISTRKNNVGLGSEMVGLNDVLLAHDKLFAKDFNKPSYAR